MPKIVKYQCDICGEEDIKSCFWATIMFRSSQYLWDDGTQDQDYDWIVCRECKLEVMRFFMDKKKQKRAIKAMKDKPKKNKLRIR